MRPLEVAGGKEAQALGLGHLRRARVCFRSARDGEAREGRGGVARDAAPRYLRWTVVVFCALTTKLVWYYSSDYRRRLQKLQQSITTSPQ